MFIASMTMTDRRYILGYFFQKGWPLGFWKSLPIFCFISSIEVDECNIGITFAPGAPAKKKFRCLKNKIIDKYLTEISENNIGKKMKFNDFLRISV